ncbi:TIGR03620 family F420-dependent LLM class oxidoreductase [Streptomyces sp. NPDC088358]|uniref:TIGR03620 family F420-dependent LLM class oxidoreductase n=1 Tax=Streptomyces sp. NPDC088358 TaxID=3365857 RepID=UPI0037F87277
MPADPTVRSLLGDVGVWSMELRPAARPEVREAAAELDELGFPALWIPGLDGGGALDDAGHLLAAAPRAAVAVGVLALWGQDPAAVGARVHDLDRAHGRRLVMGFGVSSPHSAQAAGQTYGKPLQAVADYLDRLDRVPHPVPAERRMLGALGPKMVDLAARRTAGLHPFLVTPEFSAIHRRRIGPAPVIAPHQAVVLDTDPARARAAARRGIGMFIGFPAYRNNLRRLGFTDEDLVPGGSDRLIDAVVAHGSLDVVARRVREHLDAGADHVALHVLGGDPGLPLTQWRELAGLLPVPLPVRDVVPDEAPAPGTAGGDPAI